MQCAPVFRKRWFLYGAVVICAASIVAFFAHTAYVQAANYRQTEQVYRSLRRCVKTARHGFSGRYAMVIRDLRRPDLMAAYQQHTLFPAASLIKLPILAVVFKAVQEGKCSLNSMYTITRQDIAGGSGELKRMRLPVRISLRRLLELMIAKSDNTATNKVIDILGFAYINRSFDSFGLRHTVLRRKMMDFSARRRGIENYTTTGEIASLLERMYHGRLIGPRSSKVMLGILKKQKMRDRIPRYLPEGVVVAHKTGLERGVVHDAGIIFSRQGDYLVCVLTKGVSNYAAAKKFIGRVSFAAYQLYRDHM